MWWWILAGFAAFFIKGICGFANSLVFSSILSFHVNNIAITPVELVLGYPANLLMAWNERKSIQKQIALPLSAATICGSIAGVIFLKYTNVRLVKIIFGFAIIGIAAEMLYEEISEKKRQKPKGAAALLGLTGGLLCGMYGIGALLGAYVSSQGVEGHSFKGTISLVFSIENTMRIVLSVMLGIVTISEIRKALLLIPVMFAGMAAGMAVSRAVDDRKAKKLVILLLILSGTALIIQNLFT